MDNFLKQSLLTVPFLNREQAQIFMQKSLKNLDDKEEKIKEILQNDLYLPHSLNFIVNYINSDFYVKEDFEKICDKTILNKNECNVIIYLKLLNS
jgi:hypothetical protein